MEVVDTGLVGFRRGPGRPRSVGVVGRASQARNFEQHRQGIVGLERLNDVYGYRRSVAPKARSFPR